MKRDLTINDLLYMAVGATLMVIHWGVINPWAIEIMNQNGTLGP